MPGIVGIAYNEKSKTIVVAGRFTNTIYELNPLTGNVVAQHTAGGLNQPAGLAVDSSGNVYVANNGGNTITVFSSDFGSSNTITLPNFGVGDNLPSGLAFDSSGKLLISTFAGVGVLQYDPNSGVTVPFSSANPVANGMAAVDSSNNLYVGGAAFSNSVTKFDSAGNIVGGVTIDSALLPQPPLGYTSPDFTSPAGVSIDGNGNLLVAALGRTNPFSPSDNFQSNGGLFQFDSSGNLLSSLTQTAPYSSIAYISSVPEPGSVLTLLATIGAAWTMRRYRKKTA